MCGSMHTPITQTGKRVHLSHVSCWIHPHHTYSYVSHMCYLCISYMYVVCIYFGLLVHLSVQLYVPTDFKYVGVYMFLTYRKESD